MLSVVFVGVLIIVPVTTTKVWMNFLERVNELLSAYQPIL